MNKLKALREKTGLNMKTFAESCQIPYRTYQNWETEIRPMPNYIYHLLSMKVTLIEKEYGSYKEYVKYLGL